MSAIEFRPLRAEDVEVRVNQCSDKGCSLLLYKTSRTDMALLDETIGPENWQKDYRSIDGKLFCGIGIRFKDGEWVWKWDTGVPSNMESQKGEASDAAKRAGFVWGIGRELYTAPRIWVGPDKCTIRAGKNGKWQCYDDFRVTEMEVEDGQITKLQICNMSHKGVVVYGPKGKSAKDEAPKSEDPTNDVLRIAYKRMGEAIQNWCARHGDDSPERVERAKEGVKKRPDWEANRLSLEYINQLTREFEDG